MRTRRILKAGILCFIFMGAASARAQADVTSHSRREIILKTLDCMERGQAHRPEIDWSEVCQSSVKSSSPESTGEYELQQNGSGEWELKRVGSQQDSQYKSLYEPQYEPPHKPPYVSPYKDELAELASSADENEDTPEIHPKFHKPELPNRNPDRRWELGLEFFNYKYEQEKYTNNLGSATQKTNEGLLVGFHAGLEQVLSQNPPLHSFADILRHPIQVNRYQYQLNYRTGKAEYSDIRNSPKEDFRQHLVEASAVGGYDITITDHTYLTPFIGLGYRFLSEDSGTILDNPAGLTYVPDGSTYTRVKGLRQSFDRYLQFLYLPVGLTTTSDIENNLSLRLNLEFDAILWGNQKSFLQDIGPIYTEDGGTRTVNLRNIDNRLKGGFGFKASTRLTYKQNPVDWYVEPFFRYWKLNQSDDEQYPLRLSDGQDTILYKDSSLTKPYDWIEPENTTTEVGVQVGIVY